ncbi:hypothetical protein [Acinetobacter bereziniae]|uniref:hypothetical protein n=1 Tax=Acinetobacter bereziniae TaxID=106648 RepID=UPI0020753EA0|nr:hypothetical protein [Acinetobacter bereziniae]MCM8510921.1 hypothetical protein [Acinetobacter bereziniae]MCU4539546.1 hypothetical protein [Acinetobacter bereziniae]
MTNEIDENDEIVTDDVIQVCYALLTESKLLSAMNSLLTLKKNQWLNIYDDWLVHESKLFHSKLKEVLISYSIELNDLKNAYVLRTELPKSKDPNYQMIFFLNEETLEQGSSIYNFGFLKAEIDRLINPST